MATLKTKNLVKLVSFSSYGPQWGKIISERAFLIFCLCVFTRCYFIIFQNTSSCSSDPGSSEFGEKKIVEKKYI